MQNLLKADSVLPMLAVSNKEHLLQVMATFAAKQENLDKDQVFRVLFDREKLSSTGVGRGVAIPHSRLGDVKNICGFFASLYKPIPFNSVDGSPVDLVFMILAPANSGTDHLKALSKAARLLRDPEICRKLRDAETAEELYSILTAGIPDMRV